MTTQVTGSGVNFNGSTSGTILLTQPAVAGSNTITLPAETGTARTTVSSGTVLQVVNYQTGAYATGSTVMPLDNTTPQNTEGNEYMSLAITPKSATSKLKIEVVFFGSTGGTWISAALFQDSTANALASGFTFPGVATASANVNFTHYMTSGTTSSTTFKVRAGVHSADTMAFNGQTTGARFNGTMASSITITEVVP